MGTNTYGYAYDPIGNRIVATNNAVATAYLANELNQYTNVVLEGEAPSEPQHDDDGNLLSHGDWTFGWNGENRMILASNATHVVTYAYDHQGRMMAKTVDGVARRYLWDEYNIIRETITDQQSSITNHFVWGLDLSGSLQGAGGVGGLLAEVKDGVPFFAAFDANGNVTEYVATNGLIAAHYEYSPSGEIVAQSRNPALPQSDFTHRFSTKPWCEVTGLSEYEYRKYSPGLGRWVSRDPIGEMGGWNRASMCRNDCLRHVDIDGRVTVPWGPPPYVSPPAEPQPQLPPTAPDPIVDPWRPPDNISIPDPMTGIYCSIKPCVDACAARSPSAVGRQACVDKCQTLKLLFDKWFAAEEDTGWTDGLPKCPCDIGMKRKAGHAFPGWDRLTDKLHGFHIGATLCMRSRSIAGHANQCCYDECGKLITHGSGAGSADKSSTSSITGVPGHYLDDVLPAEWARDLDGGSGHWGCWSEAYLIRRPQVGATKCERNP
jgi:RHS repeat-associated protein